jgi:hypothetical protein
MLPQKISLPSSEFTDRGGLRAVSFTAPELQLHGFWCRSTQNAKVQVPIFAHEFYPKLGHTPDEIKRNIQTREVIIPSLASLRQSGYNVDRVAFITEINVHFRHEKNLNYFRFEIPAILRTLAKRENITLILIANDNPSGKLKRKVVLNLWRDKFPPFFLKGKQFMSGRMSYFIVPPTPEILTGIRKSLNLENLEEIAPHYGFLTPKNSYVAGKEIQNIKNRLVQGRIQTADSIASQLTDYFDRELVPILSKKLNLSPEEEKQLESKLNSPEAAESFLREYKNNYFNKAKSSLNWAKGWLWENIKPIVQNTVTNIGMQAGNIVISIAVSVLVNSILGKINPRLPTNIQIKPISRRFDLAGSSIFYSPRQDFSKINTDALAHTVIVAALKSFDYIAPIAFGVRSWEDAEVFKTLMSVFPDPTSRLRYKIIMSDEAIKKASKTVQGFATSSFSSPEKRGRFLRLLNQHLITLEQKGELDVGQSASSDTDLYMFGI